MKIGIGKRSNSTIHPHPSSFKKNSNQAESITKTSSEIGVASTKVLTSTELPINEESELVFQRKESNLSLNTLKEPHAVFADQDDIDQTTFEDGRVSGVEYTKFLVIEGIITLMASIGTFLTIFSYELEFDDSDPALLEILLWTGLVVTLFLIPLTAFRYLQLIKYYKSRNLVSKKTNLFTSGKLLTFLFEIIILLLQPYPFFRGIRFDLYSDVEGVSYFYYLNDILSLLIVLRLYVVIRLYLNISVYRSPRARRVTIMYGAENSYLYACKCKMKENPTANVLFFFFSSVFVFGYMIRICERPLNRNENVIHDFRNYSNSMWLIIVTMTTVGYGDFFPRTHLGRAVVLLVCIWGVFVVSLMVISLNNILTLSIVEEKSLTVLKRLNLRKKLKHEAAKILTNMAKARIDAKKNHKVTNKYHLMNLKKYLNIFRTTLRQLKHTNDSGNITEEMHTRFDMIGNAIHDLALKQKNLEDVVQNINHLVLSNEKVHFETANSFVHNS